MFGRNFSQVISFVCAIFILALIFLIHSPTPAIVSNTYTAASTTTPAVSVSISPSVFATDQSPIQPLITSATTTASTTDSLASAIIPLPATSTPDFDDINTAARAAVVNIFCTTPSGPLDAISGSGVVISPDGIILTNAHIAEYFLLNNFDGQTNFVTCSIRTGSPAQNTYKAKLVYLPLIWIQNNADVISSSSPTGTGEHDYAFLKVTTNTDGSALTVPLPYVPLDIDEDTRDGDNILLASYPASFLGGISIEEDLYQISAIAQVADLITFASSTLDMISIPGTVVSQKGSSGGAAVNDRGQLVGIITTSSDGDTTAGRDLRAITASYINSDIQAQENTTIANVIENSDEIAQDFQENLAPIEENILTKAILGN